MRKTLIALMFAAALPAVAMAMPPENGGTGHGGMHGHNPYAQLNLTPDQRQQVGKIMWEGKRGREDITSRYLQMLTPAQQKSYQDELTAQHTKATADVRALLKPDQQKQFDVIQQKEAQRRADHAEFQAWKAQKAQQTQ
ncbi:LTXXQ domain protein [Pseudomonas sp. NA-150]|uniref:LTXXQ domain protein n=1 Tax=Pseudomonas sp. NA-150 TaxID=3367525 RepID=UPI0037C665C4